MKPLRCLLGLVTGVVAGVAATPALASFPGRDGLLAVTPLRGPGVALLDVHGHRLGGLCGHRSPCQGRFTARWSSDGRQLALSPLPPGGILALVYPDGSCLSCDAAPGEAGAAFTTDPAVLSVISGGRLSELGIDGLAEGGTLTTGISDAVWSVDGRLAVIRAGWIWIGYPGALRPFARGGSPTWSPDGARLAIVARNWVTILSVNGRHSRRLVQGSAPAWSPDGRQIAFFTAGHRLSVIGVSGGRARALGRTRGLSVDWQPVPATPAPACVTPPHSQVMAQSATGLVTSDGGSAPFSGTPQPAAYMGCLRADGRERLLESDGFQSQDGETGAVQAATSGDYAALVNYASDYHYGGISEGVTVYDLRTGAAVPGLGGENINCPDGYSAYGTLGDLVINQQGYSAAVATSYGGCNIDKGSMPAQQLQVSDSQGVRVVDSALGFQPHISNLTLVGDVLSWQHDGQPETIQLH